MIRQPPISTRTDPLFPYTPLCRPALDADLRARVADRETLARLTRREQGARGRAIEDGVADDAVVLADERARHRRAHDDAAARQALADIVVGVAEHLQSDALAKKGAERLARSAAQAHLHMIVGEAFHPEARGDFGRQARADRAVRVADVIGELHPLAALEQWLGVAENLRVEAVGHRVAEIRSLRAALGIGRVAQIGRAQE